MESRKLKRIEGLAYDAHLDAHLAMEARNSAARLQRIEERALKEALHLSNKDPFSAARQELYADTNDDDNDDNDEEQQFLLSNNQTNKTGSSIPLISTAQLIFLSFYSIGFGALWTFLLVVALPKQITSLNNVTDTNKGKALGVILLAGGVVSCIEPPIVGWLSDRTKTRWGRRKPFIVVGSILVCVFLSFLPHAKTLPMFTCIYISVQIFSNLSSSANLGLLPDLVPPSQIGRASGMVGACGACGQLLGASSGFFISKVGLTTVYSLMSLLYLVCMIITVCCVQEEPISIHLQRQRQHREEEEEEEEAAENEVSFSCWTCFDTFTQTLFSNVDFRWVFITRLLYNMGIYSVQEFLQYYVHDVILLDGWTATSEVSALFVPLLLGAIFSAFVGGRLSDHMNGKRKIFLYVSGTVQVMICLLLSLNKSFAMAMCLSLAFGLASGTYAAVDFAVVLDVLTAVDSSNSRSSKNNNVARDLGVWHVSLVLPQLLSTPLSGWILDIVRKEYSNRAGYGAIFTLSAFWFMLSTAFVSKIKGVR